MFYPRLVDNTNISFTKAQTSLLNKFLRYNMHYKRRRWITALALEAATAMSFVPTHEQEFVRQQV
jgi:ribosomal protein L16/L10AE